MKSHLKKIFQWLTFIYVIGIVLALPLFFGIIYPIPIPYLWMKMIHIISVICLIGNMVIGPVWLMYALRTKNNSLIHFSMLTLCWMDVIFTAPAFMLALVTGLILSPTWGSYYQAQWILFSLLMLAVAGLLAIPIMKYQYRLLSISSETNENKTELPNEFNRVMNRWSVWGTVIMIPFIVVMILMIVKPIIY